MDILEEHGQIAYYLVEWGIPAVFWMVVFSLAVIALFTIVYTIANLISEPGATLKSIFSVILFVGALFLAYTFVSGEIPENLMGVASKFNVTEGVMRFINMGLVTAFGFSVIALASWVLLELFNLVR